MIENCYILYSCDGSYEPIISNFSGLSAYTSSYVKIEISDYFVNVSPGIPVGPVGPGIPEIPVGPGIPVGPVGPGIPVGHGIPVIIDTCFYVLNIGYVECEPTYDISIISGDCDCQCYCYFIRSATETTDVTYVNCDDLIIVDTIQEGQTYNICSKIYPQFDAITQIPIKLTDICLDGQCPPTIPTIKPPNECDVITIFPMEVNCLVQNPTNDRTFDGAVALSISGGTPPYTVFWEVGSFAPALYNLGVGEYEATVVDYYGDFSSTTTCVLTANTLTLSGMCFVVSGVVEGQIVFISSESIGLKNGKPHYFLQYGTQQLGYVFWDTNVKLWIFCQTLDCQLTPYNTLDNDEFFYPTGTTGSWVIESDTNLLIEQSYVGPCQIPVIPKEEYDLCVSLEVIDNKGELPSISVVQIDLEPSIIINGQESWTSSTNQYLLYFNTGSTPSQWTITGFNPSTIFICNDTSYPPLSNWQVLGNPNINSVSVNVGNCSLVNTVSVSATDNDAVCGGFGSITVTASGGNIPYTYSVDGGLTYQPSPMFNNLLPGLYSVTAKDSNNSVGTFGNVTITNTPPSMFSLTLTVNSVNNTFSITAPTLPGGVTLSVDLSMISTFTYFPVGLTPTPSYNNFTLIENSNTMVFSNVTTNIIPLSGPCVADGPISAIQIQQNYYYPLTFNSNQTITGSTTNTVINPPSQLCENALGYYILNITNPIVNNCFCCTLQLTNPIPIIPIIF